MFTLRKGQSLYKKAYYSTVPLSFIEYDTYKTHVKPTPATEKKNPLIICHGLFGSKQNWKSLAKAISTQTQCQVYTIDARNHGESPHIKTHHYQAMADDVAQFISEQSIEQPMVMGHSMGGKVMMHLALNQPELVSKLIVIDMPPLPIQLGPEFDTHIKAMREINRLKLKKQKEADELLKQYEPDLVIRQFLLTNLKKNLEKDGIYEFRIPYDILGESIQQMGDFFQSDATKKYTGDTLFITGDLSPYRKQFVEQPELIKAQFPNSRVENIQGAGHWVQTEKPKEFISIASQFINEK